MSATDGLRFTPWPHERLPLWSLPALEAAKCVATQDETAFARLHLRLFEAFFADSLDIGEPAVVAGLAAECGADADRLRLDLEAGLGRQAVAADYEAAVAEHGVHAIPAVIVLETGRLVQGLAPDDAYRTAVDEALA